MKNYIHFLLAIILSIFSVGCQSITPNSLKVIDFNSIFDASIEIGKPNYKETFPIKVIDFKNIRAFVIPYYNNRTSYKLLPNGEYEAGLTTYDTTFVYCIIEKNKKFGLRYDSLTAVSFQRFPIDSLLNRINIGPLQFEGNATAEGKLVYSLNDKNGRLLEEKYFSAKGEKLDSTYRYFDYALKDLDFTLAPSVDKEKGTKLVKVVNVRKETIHHTRNEFTAEFKIDHLKNPDEILKLLERFKKDIKRIKLN